MKIFLSYHHDDNKLAGKIKHYIEREYGINVFLAHEDISPTQEWRERIIHELESCDVFIGLLTESYKESEWTDQETGFALARGIYMISVNAGLVPYGFLSKYQQLKIDSQSTYASCKEIAKLIYYIYLPKSITNFLLLQTFLKGVV